MQICSSCPRNCHVDREIKLGFCGAPAGYKLARAALHLWEEPCISGKRGSGTVFFSGCPLRCVFCQNFEISRGGFGKVVSEERLIEIFRELEAAGAHNINLVSPTQYAEKLAQTLKKYKPSVPVVYNTGGYDSVEALRGLEGLADIYLTDIKYVSSAVSEKYSGAGDYFSAATAAVKEMYRQTGPAVFDGEGMMKSGVIIRHLVLPGNISQAMRVLDWVKENLPQNTFISLMSQYLPCGEAEKYPTVNRRLSRREYNAVLDYADMLGFENVYVQELDSADGEFIPPFDLSGI